MLSTTEMTFDENGGAIGRGESNDWVLPDPDRFLSSKHCEVSFEAGQFYLVDMSTNGTFINGSPEPIGKGGKIPINDGDTIDLGDYQFSASMTQNSSAMFDDGSDVVSDPFGTSNPAPLADDFNTPVGSAAATDDSPFKPNPDAYFNNASSVKEDFSLGNLESTSVDPLAALDKSSANQSSFDQGKNAEPLLPNDPFSDSSDIFGSNAQESSSDMFGTKAGNGFSFSTQSDGGDALNQAIDWPDAKMEAGAIPEDWDDDLLGSSTPEDASALSNPFNAPDSFSQARQNTTPPDFDQSAKNVAHQSLPLTDPPKYKDASLLNERRPEAEAVDPFAEKVRAERVARREQPVSQANRPDTQQAQPKPTGVSGGAAAALLEGLGLDDRNLSDEQIEYIYRTIGELIPVIVTGMMQVLRSRASIKNEFRMNITTIQPVENNPLKFSANLDDAIENLFVRKSAAFKDPIDAFQEGFDSISEHQVAIIAGIRAAFKGFMDRFHPDQLEKQFDRQNKGVLIPGMQKSKYWNGYVDYYTGFIGNMENSFQFLFGDEFVQAYEEQLRRLAVERRKR